MSKTAVILVLVLLGLLAALPILKSDADDPGPAGGEPAAFDLDNAPMGVVAKVKVDESGRIFIDGREVTLEELEAAFAALPPKRSVVWYHRSNALQEAPPDVAAVSRQVVAAIIDAKLPVILMQEDFE